MPTLYLYRFWGDNRITREKFSVKAPSQKTAYCYIPEGMTYGSFHQQYGLFPPIEDDLDVISEVAVSEHYAMFSLTEDDEKYFVELRKALTKTQNELLQKAKRLQLDIDGRFNVFDV